MSGLALNDYLSAIAADVPSTLVSRRSFDRMMQIGALLPGSITRFFGFECRLDNEDGNADILACISTYDQERAILAAQSPAVRLPEVLWVHPAWQRIRAFAEAWNDPRGSLHEDVLNVWLEFDIHAQADSWQTPSVFFGTRPDAERGHDWIVDTALPLLRNGVLADGVRAALGRCIHALPKGAYIFQTGLMLSRADTPIRICIKSIVPADLLPYLRAIGWSDSDGRLEHLIPPLARIVDVIDLDLDIMDTVGPKIGLECSFAGKPMPHREPRWQQLMEHLVAQDMCLPSLLEPILRFAGQRNESTEHERWPQALRNMSRVLGKQYVSTVLRNLHHVKVAYCPGHRPQAKLYLSVKHLWLRKALLRQSAVHELDPG